MMPATEFLKSVDSSLSSSRERALALLWWASHSPVADGLTGKDICQVIENVGHPRQNVSRLNSALSQDKRFVSRVPGADAWRLHPRGKNELDSKFGGYLTPKPKPVQSDSILPRALFSDTRGYIEKVVNQINGSYDAGFYDCCAVMCRRLLETLIIEVYEASGRADAIKGRDGNFYMLAELANVFENDSAFRLSRNGQQGLRDFKKLGDLSAHNRRFNARKEDIDRARDGMRVASEELLHMANLSS